MLSLTDTNDIAIFVNIIIIIIIIPGIPCPIIVAWAIGKLYYENEQ